MRGATSDLETFEQVFVHREYDFSGWPAHEAAIDEAYAADPSPAIIDCGANVGYSSIWFAQRYPRATVYAIEPEPGNYVMLERNVAPYPNIKPIAAGISDAATHLSLVNPDNAAWSCRTIVDEHGKIPAVTVANLLGDRAPLIVKVDIEGHEAELFRSNTAWVQSTPLVVFEMHDWLIQWGGTAHAVLRCLTQEQRDYLTRGENMFSFARPAKLRAEYTAAPLMAAGSAQPVVSRRH